jgi:hypothetical protein
MQNDIIRDMGFLTEQDVAEIAQVKPGTLEYWRKHGKGPKYILFGKSFLYPKDLLTNFLVGLIKDPDPDPDFTGRCI